MRVPLLDLKTQFATIKDAVMPAIDEVCQSQLVCLGPAVQQFDAMEVIETWSPGHDDPPVLFTRLQDASPIFLGRYEMQVAQ